MNNPIIFFDLEETLIDDIGNKNILTDTGIRQLIRNYPGISGSGIFSFAIYTESDKEEFLNSELKTRLEIYFGMIIEPDLVVPLSVIKRLFLYNKRLYMDDAEIPILLGKEYAFQQYIRMTFTSGEFLLVDDTVDDTFLFLRDRHLSIRTYNVKEIRDANKK